MFNFFKKLKNRKNRIEKKGYIVYKYTDNLECGIYEEILGIYNEEEEAIKRIEEEIEFEKDLGNIEMVEFEYEWETWIEKA